MSTPARSSPLFEAILKDPSPPVNDHCAVFNIFQKFYKDGPCIQTISFLVTMIIYYILYIIYYIYISNVIYILYIYQNDGPSQYKEKE